jgi:hypothetical protein
MKITGILGAILLISVLMSANVLAELASLDDTKIDYLPYRELESGKPGVVYQMKIMNTGSKNKTYEIIPDTNAIKEIGSYRVDPATTVKISPGKEETLYFFLANEKQVGSRRSIPVEIRSGNSSTTINLVARPIGPFQEQNNTGFLDSAIKAVFYALLIILIIVLIIRLFARRKREGPKDGDSDNKEGPEVETYY